MAHLQEGWSYHEIALSLRVHKITVRGWVQRFKAEG
jgi:transposase